MSELKATPGPLNDAIKALSERANQTRDQWDQMGHCPFCGARGSEYHISVSYSYSAHDPSNCRFFGECDECAASGPSKETPEAALEAWGRRQA